MEAETGVEVLRIARTELQFILPVLTKTIGLLLRRLQHINTTQTDPPCSESPLILPGLCK